MKINIGTYSFGGIATFLRLGLSLREKLEKIKEMGFDGVELLAIDLEQNSVEDIQAWCKELGLEIVSVHAMPTEEIVQKMAKLGGKAVICPMAAFNTKEEAMELGAELDELAKMAEPYGIKVGYHNHQMEFFVDQGKPLLTHLIEHTSLCYFQLDCGWAQYGGCYPPSFIREHLGRFMAIHVKENSKVMGPGPRPASRHAESAFRGFGNVEEMSVEEREAILQGMLAQQNSPEELAKFSAQCKMGAPESNIDWQEIKNALDEQEGIEAFWVIEREGFYTDHDTCIREDAAYVHEHVH